MKGLIIREPYCTLILDEKKNLGDEVEANEKSRFVWTNSQRIRPRFLVWHK